MSSGAAANGGARLATLIGSLATVPVVARSLGADGYGIYVILTGFVGILPVADLGVSLGVVTLLSQSSERALHRRVISTAAVLLCSLSVLLGGVGLVLVGALDWHRLLAVPETETQLDIGVLTVVVALAVGMPANLGHKVLLGLGRTHQLAAWQASAVPATVLAILLIAVGGGGLAAFVAAATLVPVVVAAAATVWVFVQHRSISPRPFGFHRATAKELLGLGAGFSANSVANLAAFQSDALVIAHFTSPAMVGIYHVTYRLLTAVVLVSQAAGLAFWPRFGRLYGAGNLGDMRILLDRLTTAAVVGGTIFVGGALVGARPFIRFWAGETFDPPIALVGLIGLLVLFQLAHVPQSMMLSGAGRTRIQALTAVAMATANLPLSILATKSYGVLGPAIGSCIALGLLAVIPSRWYATHRLLAVTR